MSVHSIQFFTGICVLHIDRTKCESTQRIENSGIKNHSSDFRYYGDSRFLNLLRSTYNWISWDYASQERVRSHPRIDEIMKVRSIRLFLRVFIVPIRYFIYFLIQLRNLYNLKKLLKVIRDM